MDTQKQIAPEATSGEPPNELSRRTVLAGVAATTVAAGVTGIDVPANAAGTDPRQDMIAFIFLSAALTGIAENKLSTGFGPLPPGQIDLTKINPGSDPVDIKKDYFNHVMGKDADGFRALLKIARDNVNAPDREKAIIDKVQSSDQHQISRPQHRLDVVPRRLVRSERAAARQQRPEVRPQLQGHLVESLHAELGNPRGARPPDGF